MNIEIFWHNPTDLLEGKNGLTFSVDNQHIPDEPGCYVFFNEYGNSKSMIYIGKATSLRERINHQFKTNVKLSNFIKDYGRGYKRVICCTIQSKSGQRIERILTIVEKNLIRQALTSGHELINIQGSKIYFHEITTVRGNRTAGSLFGRKILSQIK
jgi:hypothetical protein